MRLRGPDRVCGKPLPLFSWRQVRFHQCGQPGLVHELRDVRIVHVGALDRGPVDVGIIGWALDCEVLYCCQALQAFEIIHQFAPIDPATSDA